MKKKIVSIARNKENTHFIALRKNSKKDQSIATPLKTLEKHFLISDEEDIQQKIYSQTSRSKDGQASICKEGSASNSKNRQERSASRCQDGYKCCCGYKDASFNELTRIELQKLNVVDTEFINENISAEAGKINRLIGNLEALLSSLKSTNMENIPYKVGTLQGKVNSLILSMSFLCSKVLLQSQKLAISLETTQSISRDYREALQISEEDKAMLQEKIKQKQANIQNLRTECDRLRAVSDSYQRKVHDSEDRLFQNQKIIEEMNCQIEAAEFHNKKHVKNLKEAQLTFQQQLLKMQKMEQVSTLAHQKTLQQLEQTRKLVQMKQEQISKWRDRCFQAQKQ